MERQRLADWEKQRKAELMSHRQREQEHVLVLKAKQEHINSDLDKLVKAVEERHSDKHFWSWIDENKYRILSSILHSFAISVTRLGDLLDFGQLFKAFGSN